MTELWINQLSISNGETNLLHNIQARIPLGELTTIIGPSGAGKTVLVKSILGSIPPGFQVRGTIFLDQVDLLQDKGSYSQQVRGKRIGYLPQNPMAIFNPRQRVIGHFIDSLKSHQKISREVCRKLAGEKLELVGLAHTDRLLDAFPWELSGGTLQRIMLAILLALEPSILILDEPTSALDAYHTSRIVKTIKDLLAMGKTILLVSHDYALVRELGGHVLVIEEGIRKEFAPIGELLLNSQFTDRYDSFLQDRFERLVK